MADIATIWNPALGEGDWTLLAPVDALLADEAGGLLLTWDDFPLATGLASPIQPSLVSGQDLQTAVLISLFTDRQAAVDDVLNDASQDPRGWWGDLGQTYPIGSRLWLRQRSKQTPQTLQLVKGDIAEALQWLIDDGVVASIDIDAQWQASGFLAAVVTLNQSSGALQALRFSWAWKELG
jgi:phage gp46-like protein